MVSVMGRTAPDFEVGAPPAEIKEIGFIGRAGGVLQLSGWWFENYHGGRWFEDEGEKIVGWPVAVLEELSQVYWAATIASSSQGVDYDRPTG